MLIPEGQDRKWLSHSFPIKLHALLPPHQPALTHLYLHQPALTPHPAPPKHERMQSERHPTRHIKCMAPRDKYKWITHSHRNLLHSRFPSSQLTETQNNLALWMYTQSACRWCEHPHKSLWKDLSLKKKTVAQPNYECTKKWNMVLCISFH